jgi:large subunit ribosomal protein L24
VMLVDPSLGSPTRIGYRLEGGKKVRIARKSGVVIN